MRKSLFLPMVAGLMLGGLLLPGCSDSTQEGADQAAAHTAGSGPRSLPEAQTLAAREDKPILIDFFAEWCGPCKRFARESREDAEIRAALDQVILLTVDSEKQDGVALAQRFEVRGYPTFVLVNAQGETLNRWTGYSKAFFLQSLERSLTDLTPLEERRERFAANPTEDDAAALGRYHATSGDPVTAIELFRRAAELRPTKDHAYAAEIFGNIASAGEAAGYSSADIYDAADDVLAMAPQMRDSWDLLMLATTILRVSLAEAQPQRGRIYVDAALAETAEITDPSVVRFRESLLADYACQVRKDPLRAMVHKKASLADGWDQRCGDLNALAWWCFQNRVQLEEAEQFARRGVQLAEPGGEKGMILDTLAEICCARGNPAEAVTLMEDALAEVPESEYYQKQLERFRDLASAH